jgi:hypothetical protein
MLMEARAPNYRLLNAKNLRQVITNALYFELMTKMRIARVALAYVSRSGSVTLVSVNLERCGTVLAAAALSPLKGGEGGVRYVFNTATRVGINARIRIEAFDALGVDTSSEAVGDSLPSWLVLPKADPPAPAPPPPPPPPPPARRPRRASPPPRRTESPEPPVVGAPSRLSTPLTQKMRLWPWWTRQPARMSPPQPSAQPPQPRGRTFTPESVPSAKHSSTRCKRHRRRAFGVVLTTFSSSLRTALCFHASASQMPM